jgi:hypothetical protein
MQRRLAGELARRVGRRQNMASKLAGHTFHVALLSREGNIDCKTLFTTWNRNPGRFGGSIVSQPKQLASPDRERIAGVPSSR